MTETKRVDLIAEAEKLVPAVKEDYRRAGHPEPPSGITGGFVLALALDAFKSVVEGRQYLVPAGVVAETHELMHAVDQAVKAGHLTITETEPTAH